MAPAPARQTSNRRTIKSRSYTMMVIKDSQEDEDSQDGLQVEWSQTEEIDSIVNSSPPQTAVAPPSKPPPPAPIALMRASSRDSANFGVVIPETPPSALNVGRRFVKSTDHENASPLSPTAPQLPPQRRHSRVHPRQPLQPPPRPQLETVRPFQHLHHLHTRPPSSPVPSTSSPGHPPPAQPRQASSASSPGLPQLRRRTSHGASALRSGVDMDTSQSPTQSNDDRDYDRFHQDEEKIKYKDFFASPSRNTASQPSSPYVKETPAVAPAAASISPIPKSAQAVAESQSATHEPETLDEGDAGAVNFAGISPAKSGNYGPLPPPQQCLDRADDDSQFPPETPAQPQNPFVGLNRGSEQVYGASQLFGQTSQTGAAFTSALRPRNLSPTSSRPSPCMMAPNTISPNPPAFISSPLNGGIMPSSPPDLDPITPGTALAAPSSMDHHMIISETPSRLPKPKMARPDPKEDYIPRKESQENDGHHNALPRVSEGDKELTDKTDQDLGYDPVRNNAIRRLAAKNRKAVADQDLSNISFARSESNLTRQMRPPQIKRFSSSADYMPLPYQTKLAGGDDDGDSTEGEAEEPDGAAVIIKNSFAIPNKAPFKKAFVIPATSSVPAQAPRRNGFAGTDAARRTMDVNSSERIPETSPVLRPTADTMGAITSSEPQQLSLPQMSSSATASPPEAETAATVNDASPGSSAPIAQTPAPSVKTAMNVNDASPGSSVPIAARRRPARKRAAAVKKAPLSRPKPKPDAGGSRLDEQLSDADVTIRDPGEDEAGNATPQAPVSSPLSDLGTTPNPDTDGTPATQEQSSPSRVKAATDPQPALSPSGPKTTSISVQELPELPKPPPQPLARPVPLPLSLPPPSSSDLLLPPRRKRRRIFEHDSTDELARSGPPTPVKAPITASAPRRSPQPKAVHKLAAAKSTRNRKSSGQTKARSESREASEMRNASGIFHGMTFAVSFLGKQAGETQKKHDTRQKEGKGVEESIVQNGGRILQEGFDELFSVPSLRSLSSPMPSPVGTPASSRSRTTENLTVLDWAKSCGFTALIADGHTRKTKYMQALALGIPCLSHKWVTACIRKGEIVPWDSYLLCAGSSSVLGAIRSRAMMPYSAVDSQFVDVIATRNKLLEGQSILVVMKKSPDEESRKKAYVFLAHILGAAQTRAFTIDEGRKKMREREEAGAPFDWVYFEGDEVEEGLFGEVGANVSMNSNASRRGAVGVAKTRAKKRKRASMEDVPDDGPPPKRVKALSNELVIQSLILGRLVEDEEMNLV